jgi:hypothetical protein
MIYHCTYEEDQGIIYVLELMKLTNLDYKSEPS